MIVYSTDRKMNVLGLITSTAGSGYHITADTRTEEIESGVASLNLTVSFEHTEQPTVDAMLEPGNYLLIHDDDSDFFFTIIDSDTDSKNQSTEIYAEDAGLDLLNEVVAAYTATTAHSLKWYVNKYIDDTGFEIGVNEATGLTRTLEWEGEATITERLVSIATEFGNYEISYSFDIDRFDIVHRYVNIQKQRGSDNGRVLRLGRDIDRILTHKTIENVATAYYCTGGTKSGEDSPITLSGCSYDDGDYYIDGKYLKSRTALQKWARADAAANSGHIVKQYSYDTKNQQTLCRHALSSLKQVVDTECTYEAEFLSIPDDLRIGDCVSIVDSVGELYLSARLLKTELSRTSGTFTAELGDTELQTVTKVQFDESLWTEATTE